MCYIYSMKNRLKHYWMIFRYGKEFTQRYEAGSYILDLPIKKILAKLRSKSSPL